MEATPNGRRRNLRTWAWICPSLGEAQEEGGQVVVRGKGLSFRAESRNLKRKNTRAVSQGNGSRLREIGFLKRASVLPVPGIPQGDSIRGTDSCASTRLDNGSATVRRFRSALRAPLHLRLLSIGPPGLKNRPAVSFSLHSLYGFRFYELHPPKEVDVLSTAEHTPMME